MWNIPNLLTLFRILLIPAIVCMYYAPTFFDGLENAHIWAFVFFVLAAVTDWFDGYLARKLNQSTPFGALLDPLADKLMVAVVLVVLVDKFDSVWITIPAAVIVMREILVSGLREWMAELGERAKVKVSWVGKFKTTFQMIGLALLLLFNGQPSAVASSEGLAFSGEFLFSGVGILFLVLATVLTLWSMIKYLVAAWPYLK